MGCRRLKYFQYYVLLQINFNGFVSVILEVTILLSFKLKGKDRHALASPLVWLSSLLSTMFKDELGMTLTFFKAMST